MNKFIKYLKHLTLTILVIVTYYTIKNLNTVDEKIDKTYGLDANYLTSYLSDFALKDFKICSPSVLAEINTVDTMLTYSKEFDGETRWTIFKELVAGEYKAYFDINFNFKDSTKHIAPCFYDGGVFKDNMLLENIPSGYINQIYFVKYDEKKKRYYGKIFGRGLDGSGQIQTAKMHELRVPPQKTACKGDYGYWDSLFYIQKIDENIPLKKEDNTLSEDGKKEITKLKEEIRIKELNILSIFKKQALAEEYLENLRDDYLSLSYYYMYTDTKKELCILYKFRSFIKNNNLPIYEMLLADLTYDIAIAYEELGDTASAFSNYLDVTTYLHTAVFDPYYENYKEEIVEDLLYYQEEIISIYYDDYKDTFIFEKKDFPDLMDFIYMAVIKSTKDTDLLQQAHTNMAQFYIKSKNEHNQVAYHLREAINQMKISKDVISMNHDSDSDYIYYNMTEPYEALIIYYYSQNDIVNAKKTMDEQIEFVSKKIPKHRFIIAELYSNIVINDRSYGQIEGALPMMIKHSYIKKSLSLGLKLANKDDEIYYLYILNHYAKYILPYIDVKHTYEHIKYMQNLHLEYNPIMPLLYLYTKQYKKSIEHIKDSQQLKGYIKDCQSVAQAYVLLGEEYGEGYDLSQNYEKYEQYINSILTKEVKYKLQKYCEELTDNIKLK